MRSRSPIRASSTTRAPNEALPGRKVMNQFLSCGSFSPFM